MTNGFRSANGGSSRGPWLVLAVAAVVIAVAALLLTGHHKSSSATGQRGATAPTVTVPDPGGPQPTAVGTATLPYQDSSVASAEDVARRYVTAVHSLSWQSPSPSSWVTAARPTVTAAFYRKLQARVPANGQLSDSDTRYLQSILASQTVIEVVVDNVGIASGDGDGLSGSQMPLFVQYHTVTHSADAPAGIAGPTTPVQVSAVQQNGSWLINSSSDMP